MGSALLSRFDLVFIMLDKPDEVRVFLFLFFPTDLVESMWNLCFMTGK